eukprot:1188117-Prorocentrum_minimum.AAC.2
MCKGVISSPPVAGKEGFVHHAKSVLKGVLKKGSAEKYRLLPQDEKREEREERGEQSEPGISEDEVTLQSPSGDQADSGRWRFGSKPKITWGDEQGGQLNFVKEFDQHTPILGEKQIDAPKYQLYSKPR